MTDSLRCQAAVLSIAASDLLHLCHDMCCWCRDVVPAAGGVVAHADNNRLAGCSQVEHLSVNGI